MLLWLPKKRCVPPLRTVDGAAARPLADRLARVGTTGRFPVIMRAFLNCAPLAGTALPLCVPNWPAPTVERARPMWVLRRLFRFEYRMPLCSGLIPPRLMLLMLVMFTEPKRPPQPPHQGKKASHGPIGNQPKPPHPPKPTPKPPPQPKNETYAGAHSGR